MNKNSKNSETSVVPEEKSESINTGHSDSVQRKKNVKVKEAGHEPADYMNSVKIIDARLKIMEYSIDHSLEEVFQKTLDEICNISSGLSGFYFFTGEDENTLTLKGCSTGAIAESCNTEDPGKTCRLNETGILPDVVKERRPVIRNYYTGDSVRKGHTGNLTTQTGTLAVPVFRNNKIVAILSIVNRNGEFSESDIQIVSFFADIAWEIAEKKKSAEALAESEKKYHLLLDTANEAIIIAQDDELKFINRKTVEFFETYTREEITGRPFRSFIHEDDREMVVRNYMRRINGESVPTRYSFRVVINENIIKWVEVTSVLIEWEGRPATLNFYIDITGQKYAEEELKKSELFAQATLDALSTNIAILDGEGVIIAVNRAWKKSAEKNSTYNSGLYEGNNYLAVFENAAENNSGHAGRFSEGIRTVISGVQDKFSFEYSSDGISGKRWFNINITRFAFENSVRIVVAYDDITQRKIAEAEIRSLSCLVEQSPVSIVITDTEGIIKYVNPATEKTTGYSKEELVGKNPRILKSDYLPAGEYRNLWDTIKSGRYWKGQFLNIRKDRSMYWESATISPIFDEHGIIEQFAAIKEDVTEKKEAHAKIKKLLQEKELLLKEVHHRIKNNMNTIRGLLYLQSVEEKNIEASGALRDAENRVHSMMLLYDRLYRSHDFERVSIRSYLETLVDEIIKNFPNNTMVEVHKRVSDFILNANITFSLGIIINELLTNIMKYAFTGKEKGSITVTAHMKNNHAVITLSDDGNGIPESVDFKNSEGFGLNLVGMLTEQIGGSIRIERGNGAKFVLEIDI